MNQEILFSNELNICVQRPFAAAELSLLTAYQDSRLTLVADALPFAATDAPFDVDDFRGEGFNGEWLAAKLREATAMLPGGMRVCGFMLATRYASDLGLLEAKIAAVAPRVASCEALTAPEIALISCAEGRSRVVLYNTSSGFVTLLRNPKFTEFAKRVGSLRLSLTGFYPAREPPNAPAFHRAVVAAAREELLQSDFLVDGRVLAAGQRVGEAREAKLLKSSNAAVARLLSADGIRKVRGGLDCSVVLFCYYSLAATIEEVVALFCEDFERSLAARLALFDENAFLAKRFLVARGGFLYSFHAASEESAKESLQRALRRFPRAEPIDCERIAEFQWRALGVARRGSAQLADFSRTAPQLLTLCLALLLAFLLKKAIIG